jgi:CDP-glucose 4,6-dehydratase
VHKVEAFSELKSLQGPVLVTGHTGFKGAWFMELLSSLGINAVGLSLPAERGSLRDRLGSERKYSEYFVNVNDAALIQETINSIKPAFVFHLAAQAIVTESFHKPYETYVTNVLGTLNVIEATKESGGCRGIQVITTDKVYSNDNSGKPFSEIDSLFGCDPYSGSKVATEAVVSGLQKSYQEKYGILIQSVRAGNVIGGGDFAKDRLIPDLVRSYTMDSELKVRNPESTRPWQHVLDPLIGYLFAAENMLLKKDSSSFNFGPIEKSLSVDEVISIARSTWPGLKVISSIDHQSGIHEAQSLRVSPTKAEEVLGWQPVFTQQEAVNLTLNWWNKVLKNELTAFEAMQNDIQIVLGKILHD